MSRVGRVAVLVPEISEGWTRILDSRKPDLIGLFLLYLFCNFFFFFFFFLLFVLTLENIYTLDIMPPAKTTRASRKKGTALKAKIKSARELKMKANKTPAKRVTTRTKPVAASSREPKARNLREKDDEMQITKLEKATTSTTNSNAKLVRKNPGASRTATTKASNRIAKTTTKTTSKVTKSSPKKTANTIIKKTMTKKPTKAQQERARKAQEKHERDEYQKSIDAIEVMRQAVTVEAKNSNNNKINMLTERDVREIIRYVSHNNPMLLLLLSLPQIEHKLGLLETVKVKMKKVLRGPEFSEVATQQDLKVYSKPRSWFFW
jgi:hypothetical protein